MRSRLTIVSPARRRWAILILNGLGGGDDALYRAAAMPAVARSRALPALTFATGGCNSLGGYCVINPANGNLLLQLAPPAGDFFYVAPILSYNSTNASTASEIGNGWSHLFKRQVVIGGSGNPVVVTGAGQIFAYLANLAGGYYPPAPGTINSLQGPAGFTSFTETAPDGTKYQYGSAQSVPAALLKSIQNPAGSIWTVSYDANSRVSAITDPYARRTTLTYAPTGGKISAIQDSFGRQTTISVNSSGNLVQVTTPELCITSLVYGSSNRPIVWINPLGDRTSYAFDSNNRLTQATAPLGQVTSLVYNTNQTLLTNITAAARSARSRTNWAIPPAWSGTAPGTASRRSTPSRTGPRIRTIAVAS